MYPPLQMPPTLDHVTLVAQFANINGFCRKSRCCCDHDDI